MTPQRVLKTGIIPALAELELQGIKAAITTMREKGAIVLKSRDILRD